MPGILTLNSAIMSGNQAGIQQIIGPLQISGSANIVDIANFAFTSATFQTITSPVGATCAVIIPPSNNIVGLTLKGVTGDTGIPIQPNQPCVVTFAVPTNANSFGLASAGAITTGNVQVAFF